MSRPTLAAANKAQAQARALRMMYFLKVAFPSGTIYATTSGQDFRWDGQLWAARWIITGLPEVAEKPDLKPYQSEIVLSGLDAPLRSKVITDKYRYADVSCWKGFCDEAWKLVWSPHRIAKRFMSQCVLSMDGKTGSVSISAHGPEVTWRRDSAQLSTPESQRLRYATDTGLDRVVDQGTKVIEWGGSYFSRGRGDGGSFVERGFVGETREV